MASESTGNIYAERKKQRELTQPKQTGRRNPAIAKRQEAREETARLDRETGGNWKDRMYEGLPQETRDMIDEKAKVGRVKQFDSQLARKMADWERYRISNPEEAAKIDEMGGFEAFATGAGTGLANIARGVGLKDQLPPEEREYNKMLRQQKGAALAGTMVGETAPFIAPGMAIGRIPSAAGRITASTAAGGAEGAILAKGQGREVTPLDVVAGAVAGGVGEAIIGPLTSTVRQAGKAGKVVKDKITKATPKEIIDQQRVQKLIGEDVADSPYTIGDVDPEFMSSQDVSARAARRQTMEDIGVSPTEEQIGRDPTLIKEKARLVNKEGEVSEFQDYQQQQFGEFFDKKIKETGGDPHGSINAYTSVRDKTLGDDATTSRMYEEANRVVSGEEVVKLNKADAYLTEMMKKYKEKGKILGDLKRNLKAWGIYEGGGPEIQLLDSTGKPFKKADGGNVKNALSPRDVETVRQEANELFKSADPFERKILREYKQLIDEDLMDAVGTDVYAEGRDFMSGWKANLSRPKLDKLDKRAVNILEDIVSRSVNEDDFAKVLFSSNSKYKSEDILDIKRFLGEDSQEWADIGASGLEFMKQKMFKDNATSFNQFKSAMDQMGPRKLKALYGDEGVKVLKTMGRGLKLLDSAKVKSPIKHPGEQLMKERAKRKLDKKFGYISALMGDVFDNTIGRIKNVYYKNKILDVIDDLKHAAKVADEKAAKKFARKARVPGSAIPAAAPVALEREQEIRNRVP